MKEQFKKYYKSENQNAWMRILVGLLCFLGVAFLKYLYPQDLINGIFWSITLISAYQVGRGIKKLRRTQKRSKELKSDWENKKQQFIQTEKDYLNQRLPKYKFHRSIEVGIIATGIVLAMMGGLFGFGLFMLGSGIGLAIQGALALYLELVAEWYAGLFLNRLKKVNSNDKTPTV